jgi:hypothetical protein
MYATIPDNAASPPFPVARPLSSTVSAAIPPSNGARLNQSSTSEVLGPMSREQRSISKSEADPSHCFTVRR